MAGDDEKVREQVKKRISIPARWVLINKLKVMTSGGKNVCLDPI